MHRALDLPGSALRVLSPTTTAKMAARMLCASRVVAETLPPGFRLSPALDIMLALHISEDDARYPTASEVQPPTSLSPAVTQRWISALIQLGYVEERNDLLALIDQGHQSIIDLINTLYIAQRELDA